MGAAEGAAVARAAVAEEDPEAATEVARAGAAGVATQVAAQEEVARAAAERVKDALVGLDRRR